MLSVAKICFGTAWAVVNEHGNIIKEFTSNREAWREADKMNKEHASRSESTAKWSFNKSASGE